MRAEEIQVGDWFKFPMDLNIKIWGIKYVNEDRTIINQGFSYDGFLLNEIEPILITPEILEKNGFDKSNESTYILQGITYQIKLKQFSETRWDLAISNMDDDSYLKEKTIRYIHQLQHFMRDFEVDKKIVLMERREYEGELNLDGLEDYTIIKHREIKDEKRS